MQNENLVRISIIYPVCAGARFDVDYYLATHAPLALSRLGSAIIRFDIDIGVHAPPMPEPSFVAAGHYICASTAVFMNAYLPHAAELQADVANYTDIMPIIQLSHIHVIAPDHRPSPSSPHD